MRKPTKIKLNKKDRESLNTVLEDILGIMDTIENNVEEETPIKNESTPTPKFCTTKENNGEEKEFNGQNVFNALTDGHEQLADMLQYNLASIINDEDAPARLQGMAMVLHANVADVFNQTDTMFKELCKNYEHFIVQQDTLEVD